jgi:hypothetical protein
VNVDVLSMTDRAGKDEARDRIERAHAILIRVIDDLPTIDGETRMATAELDAALFELRAAKRALDDLDG